MNSYLITEEYLGNEATKADAEKMIELLQKRGFDVQYGDPNMRRLPSDWDFDAAIDFDTAIIEEVENI